MRLIQNEKSLRDLDVMLEKGTYRIEKVNQSNNRTDYYVITAPGACTDTIAVPCHCRSNWGKMYLKGGE